MCNLAFLFLFMLLYFDWHIFEVSLAILTLCNYSAPSLDRCNVLVIFPTNDKIGKMSNGYFGALKGGAIAKADPKSGLWSCVHTHGMLEKRSHSLGTAQLKRCKCSSLIFNYISHWLITSYSKTPFPQTTLSVLRVSNECCAQVSIFPQILCFSLSDHFAWNFKCIPDLAFDLCNHSGGHTS